MNEVLISTNENEILVSTNENEVLISTNENEVLISTNGNEVLVSTIMNEVHTPGIWGKPQHFFMNLKGHISGLPCPTEMYNTPQWNTNFVV